MNKTIPYEAIMTDIVKVRGEIRAMKGHAGSIVSLSSEGWIGENAPYTQTVSCEGVTDTNDVLIAPKIDDAAEMERVSSSQIMATAQGAGTIMFSAFGDKPTENIEFNIKVLI